MNLTYHYLVEYLPKRYTASFEQEQDRRTVYNFKDGICNDNLKEKFANAVSAITSYDKDNWIVLFIPASSDIKTHRRYSSLANYIKSKTGVEATIKGIENLEDTESQCLSGRRYDKTSSYKFNDYLYRGKKVILIDDVITSGRSFQTCAIHLINGGASSVQGLFLAKTVNPDWQSHVA